MLQNYNKYKVIKVFLYSPTTSFRLRELSRFTNISPLSLGTYLKNLESEGIIRIDKKNKIPFYTALRDNTNFKLYQKLSSIYEIHRCGLIEYLWNTLNPEAIIFYGSYLKGDAIESSDIDLFVLGKDSNLDITKYEKILGREIHILSEPDFNKLPKELRNNLINGLVLKGYIKVFK